jgi:nitrate reductase gamma subunit
MNWKIYVVIFVGVLIILFAVFSLFAVGAQNEQWGSVLIGAAIGCMLAIGFRVMKKKRLANKKP